MDDCHVAAQIAYIGDDVRRENDDDVLADGAQQIVEPHALLGIEAGSGLIDNNEPRIAEQRLSNAEALLHASRETAQRLIAMFPKVRLAQQRVYHIAPFPCILDPLQRGEV